MRFSTRHLVRPTTRRPTADYTQGADKWRLFLYVAALMLVLAAIERARDPATWQWMWNLGPAKAPAVPFDNKLENGGLRTARDPADTFVAAPDVEADGSIEAARGQIQDDTVIFRPAEREIWFHEVQRVRDAAPDAMKRESLGRVAYLQLARQPADYRGKVVTVAGTVRMAYRAPAAENDLGIEEYFVYWLQPAGGPDSPIVVYALDSPAGFPKIAPNMQEAQKKSAQLREEVEITGVFFKRCAYAGQGGTYTAPLMIANVPNWHRRQPIAAPPASNLSAREVAALAAVALVLAICITAVVWKRSRRPRVKDQLISVGSLTVGPSTKQSLRELEQQARGEGTA
jgi:hypothetical protein